MRHWNKAPKNGMKARMIHGRTFNFVLYIFKMAYKEFEERIGQMEGKRGERGQ